MILTFNPRLAMVMTHAHAKINVTGQSFRRLEWKQTDTTDCINQLYSSKKNFDSSINKEKTQKKKDTRSQHTETGIQTTQVIAW